MNNLSKNLVQTGKVNRKSMLKNNSVAYKDKQNWCVFLSVGSLPAKKLARFSPSNTGIECGALTSLYWMLPPRMEAP